MTLPQFPNVFYGSIFLQGEPAPSGMIVTAVVVDQEGIVRQFTLPVGPKSQFGSPNGRKLKIGGSGEPIPDRARITFYCTEGALDLGEVAGATIPEAGHAHFCDDSTPHITRLVLCQD